MCIKLSVSNCDLVNHLVDVCTTIYLPKCSLRCPYCFNLDVVDGKNLKNYTERTLTEEIINSKQKNFVITGGEALFDFSVFKLIIKIINKTNPESIQVNTNMMHPNELLWFVENVDNPLVAFDLKADLSDYYKLNPIFADTKKRFLQSLNILKINKKLKEIQCRTTLSNYVSEDTLLEMPKLLTGFGENFTWSLQDLEPKKIYSKAKVESFMRKIKSGYGIKVLHNGE